MNDDDIMRLLRRSTVFGGIDDTRLGGIATLTRRRAVTQGALLFQQGDPGDALYGVLSGSIGISIADADGRLLVINVMEPGDLFGEIALLDGLPRTASAEAVQDSVLAVIDRAPFMALLERDFLLVRHVIDLLCERLRRNTDRMGERAFLPLAARLARQLHDLALGQGRRTAEGLEVPFSQRGIADMLGVTREAVNKQLQSWLHDGIVTPRRNAVTVRDMPRLAAAARRPPP